MAAFGYGGGELLHRFGRRGGRFGFDEFDKLFHLHRGFVPDDQLIRILTHCLSLFKLVCGDGLFSLHLYSLKNSSKFSFETPLYGVSYGSHKERLKNMEQ